MLALVDARIGENAAPADAGETAPQN
jgi:hypothetical protein